MKQLQEEITGMEIESHRRKAKKTYLNNINRR
jgi:hypothetical protein